MDRLSAVIAAAALAAVACKDNGDDASHARDRVNAVKADPATEVSAEAMCDRYFEAADAPAFAWPELAGATPDETAGSWQWINVWATWCEPCVEELPHLAAWRDRLDEAGLAVELSLVSADESDEVVDAFREEHPKTPETTRLADPDSVAAWVESLGLRGATLPVQIFVDPKGMVRCLRASAVEESDVPAIEALLRG